MDDETAQRKLILYMLGQTGANVDLEHEPGDATVVFGGARFARSLAGRTHTYVSR